MVNIETKINKITCIGISTGCFFSPVKGGMLIWKGFFVLETIIGSHLDP